MKKILLLTVSLFMAYLSYGQINGSGMSCSDAILLDHSQPTSCSSNTNTNEMWYQFVADTTYMEFSAHEFMESGEITLYSGTCSNLTQLFQIDDEYLIYSSLTINTTYYIQVTGTTNNNILDVCLSNYYGENPSPSEVCEPLSDCDKVANGNFTSNTCTYPDLLFGLSYNFEQGAFQDGEVFAWTRFLGSPDLFNENIGWANMWARTAYSGEPCSEAIITCTSIEPNEIYILSLDYKRTYISAADQAITAPTAVMVDIADNQVDGFMANSSIMPTYTSPVQNIFNSGSINSDVFAHTDNLFTYTGASTMDRLIVYGQSSSNGNRRIGVDNVTITPIIYDDVITCNSDTFPLAPTCSTEIVGLDVYNDLTFLWTTAQTGAIVTGTETSLIPTIDPIFANPFIFLVLTVTNTAIGEEFTTNVQVTYQPLQVNYTSAGDCSNGTPPCTGSITVTSVSGTAPFNYMLNGTIPSLTGEFTDLCVGDYELVVTDDNGCVFTETIIIKNEALDIDINGYNTFPSQSCGLVNVTANNGVAPFIYEWTDDATPIPNIIGNDYEVALLPSGTYHVTVTDANGCSETDSVSITSSNIALAIDTTEYICNNGMANLDVPNVYDDYLWNTGATTDFLNVQELGDYTCDMYNSHGCRLQKTFHVKPYVFDIDVDALDCIVTNDPIYGHIQYELTATAGYTNYFWEIDIVNENGNSQIFTTMGQFVTFASPIWPSDPISHYTIHLTANSPDGCQLVEDITVDCPEGIFPVFDGNGNMTYFPAEFGVWEDVHWVFYSDINIPTGQQLIIKNSIIEFAPGYGIELSGATTKLIVDNSTITSLFCEDMLWTGIALKGNPDKPHTEEYQPSVFIKNNSIIKNAEQAVYSFYGAIIQAENSTFENNNIAIKFDAYHGAFTTPNSWILNNQFITNPEQELLLGSDFEEFIHLNQFRTMTIEGNTFSNSNYEMDILDRGKAIYAYDMYSMDITNNTFNRLTTGVDAILIQNVNFGEYDNIPSNYFNNNYNGAFFHAIKDLEAVNNQFDDELLMPTTDAAQMKVSGSTFPNVAHNSFNNGVVGLHLAKGNIYQVGFLLGSFQIYKNSFTNFRLYSNANLNGYPTCILTKGNHGSISLDAGAEIKCNTFTNYDYAVAVMAGEIKMIHGDPTSFTTDAPAGNTFVDDDNMPDGRFFVETGLNTGYEYRHHLGLTTRLENGTDNYYTTSAITPVLGSVAIFDLDVSCPDLSPLMQNIVVKKDEIITVKSDIATKEDVLLTKVDQGNTELLLSDIATTTDAEYTELVEEIETMDSYLSDATAIEFMDKPTTRPVAKAIGLIANSPLPSKAKAKIADLDLSDELKGYIQAQQNGLSKREQDEKEIHQLNLQKYKLLREAIQMAHKDETGEIYSEVIDLLLEQDEWSQREMAYHMLKHSSRSNEAETVFMELQQDLVNFDSDKQYHMEDYMSLLDLESQIDTLSDSLRVVNISVQEDLLQTIKASEYTEGKVAAELLLEEAGLDEKDVFNIQLPNPNTDNRSANQSQKNEAKTFSFSGAQDIIEVYPNPVDDKLTVEYIMFNGMSADKIGIYDINGKLLLSQSITKAMDIVDVNVSQLSAGTYIIAFGKDGVNSNSKKFIVK